MNAKSDERPKSCSGSRRLPDNETSPDSPSRPTFWRQRVHRFLLLVLADAGLWGFSSSEEDACVGVDLVGVDGKRTVSTTVAAAASGTEVAEGDAVVIAGAVWAVVLGLLGTACWAACGRGGAGSVAVFFL